MDDVVPTAATMGDVLRFLTKSQQRQAMDKRQREQERERRDEEERCGRLIEEWIWREESK